MAFLTLVNKKHVILPPEKAIAIWRVKVGEIKGTREQRAFVKKVDKIYLSHHNAPKSYRDSIRELYKPRPKPQPFVGQIALPYKD
jgi:hypothetical protein